LTGNEPACGGVAVRDEDDGGEVRFLDEHRRRRREEETGLPVFVSPEPVDDAEAALAGLAARALLDLEMRFGTRALYLGHHAFSDSEGAYMARVRWAVPEVVDECRRMAETLGMHMPEMPTAPPFEV
jgi:hypothetical protein